jgi:hypothetical protein
MSFVGQGGGVDDGGGDIVGRSERRRQRYLGEHRLDFGGDKHIFDERRDDRALADSLVTADTDPDWSTTLVNSHGSTQATSTNTGSWDKRLHIPVAITQHIHYSLHVSKDRKYSELEEVNTSPKEV